MKVCNFNAFDFSKSKTNESWTCKLLCEKCHWMLNKEWSTNCQKWLLSLFACLLLLETFSASCEIGFMIFVWIQCKKQICTMLSGVLWRMQNLFPFPSKTLQLGSPEMTDKKCCMPKDGCTHHRANSQLVATRVAKHNWGCPQNGGGNVWTM